MFISSNPASQSGQRNMHYHEISGGREEEYASVFAAIHRRRMNWIDVLQMQKYHPIADVAIELKKVAAKKIVLLAAYDGDVNPKEFAVREVAVEVELPIEHKMVQNVAIAVDEDSPDSDITDGVLRCHLLDSNSSANTGAGFMNSEGFPLCVGDRLRNTLMEFGCL